MFREIIIVFTTVIQQVDFKLEVTIPADVCLKHETVFLTYVERTFFPV